MKPRIFITRKIPESAIKKLSGTCQLEIWPDPLPPPYEILVEKAHGAAGLLYMLTDRIDAPLMDAAGPSLQVLSGMAVGFDNVDETAASQRKIPVGHTPGVLTETTADLAFALLMAAARRLPEAIEYARSGQWRTWSPTALLGRDIHHAVLGIVGMGRIGQAVARRAAGFNMRLLYTGRGPKSLPGIEKAEYVEMPELLARSDFISLHVPLNEHTRHMINAETLAQMKPEAMLVNTSRGGLVDHEALYDALMGGRIGRAALDVTDPEPLPADHRLYRLSNCLIVPHVGSASFATRAKMADMAAENILAGLKGVPLPHCANPSVYT